MVRQRFRDLVVIYQQTLRDAGIQPQIVNVAEHLSRGEILGHCLWVLNEKFEPLIERIGGVQEATRLLGCIQGTVMACGLCTIAETRDHANQAKLTWEKIVD